MNSKKERTWGACQNCFQLNTTFHIRDGRNFCSVWCHEEFVIKQLTRALKMKPMEKFLSDKDVILFTTAKL